jgi:methylase of polypeptide subunit release factors
MNLPFSPPAHEPRLSRDQRRANGVFYTPWEVAEWIVRATYGPLLAAWQGVGPPPTVIDPACGGGVFLAAANEQLQDRCRQLNLSPSTTSTICSKAVCGVDIDPHAVAVARSQLPQATADQVRVGDSLGPHDERRWDAIVGNPPYVSIRELVRTHGRSQVEQLRESFTTARGNFDLYVLFLERSLQMLKPGGRLGMIIPNKWATLDYARELRRLLLQSSLEQVVDLSHLRVFPQASTYPQIVVLEKRSPAQNHRVHFASELGGCSGQSTPQASLDPRGFVFGDNLRVEERTQCVSLNEVCTLHSGASGYAADQLASALFEQDKAAYRGREDAVDFVVSGNLDRYSLQLGQVRFLNRKWQRPLLSLAAPVVSSQKRLLYREPKLVFSGLSRRLEVAYDHVGCALGVQVYAASQLTLEPYFLLGLLNSRLLSYLFRQRFASKRLAGGYLAINKGQLAQLPIRHIASLDSRARSIADEIRQLAEQLHDLYVAELDDHLDALVYDLYELTAAERRQVDESFAAMPTKAAPRRAA